MTNQEAREATRAALRQWESLYRTALETVGDPDRARKMVERYFDGILQGENARNNDR